MSRTEICGLVDSMFAHFDQENAKIPPFIPFRGQDVPIACSKGCYYCCHLEVGISAAELIRIISWLENDRPSLLGVMRGKVADARKAIGHKVARKRKALRVMCPLLVDGVCSIYPVRPLSCRSYVSCDVNACRTDWQAPGIGKKVPRSGLLSKWSREYSPQLQQKAALLRVPIGAFELIRALECALTVEDFVEKLLSDHQLLKNSLLDPRVLSQ